MNKKDVTSALKVIAISGVLLAVSTLTVLHIVTSTEVDWQAPDQYVESKDQIVPEVTLASSNVPVLKVEAKNPVSTIKEYMEKTLTDEDIQLIYNYADNNTNAGPLSNRKMSDQEVKRMRVLTDQYTYEGIRPEKELPLKAGDYNFYFDINKDTYYYPIRPLTDEELLQYIDWIEKINYTLSKRIVPLKPDTKDITEASAVKKAKESISKLYDGDVSELEMFVSYMKLGPEQKGVWFVLFQPYMFNQVDASGETYIKYDVTIDSLSGAVIDSSRFISKNKLTPIPTRVSEQIKHDQSWITRAKTIVTEKQGEERSIVKASRIQDDKYDKRGIVAISIELEDGSKYVAEMKYPQKILRSLLYEPAVKLK